MSRSIPGTARTESAAAQLNKSADRAVLLRMTSEGMNWESAYREEGDFVGPPPWDIGEPQPELAALIQTGKFRSVVLDAGCGFAELSRALASDGYSVVGIDLTPTAIAAATKATEDRGLSN